MSRRMIQKKFKGRFQKNINQYNFPFFLLCLQNYSLLFSHQQKKESVQSNSTSLSFQTHITNSHQNILWSLQQKYSHRNNNNTISNHNHLQQTGLRGNKNKLYIKSAALQTKMRSHWTSPAMGEQEGVGGCWGRGYLQQASALREVWLSRLLSVSDAMVGSLLVSVGSVDMDETSLTEEDEGEEVLGWGGLSITAAPVLRKTHVNE